MKSFRDQKTVEREKDLAEKRAKLGESLPDVGVWEEYIRDPENESKFLQQLRILEKATDQQIQLLADRPGILLNMTVGKNWPS